jgi:opacity protein-like surface antigen
MRCLFPLLALLCLAGVASAAPVPSPLQLGFGVHGDFTRSNLPGPQIDGLKPLQDAYGPGGGGGAHLDVGMMGLGVRLSGDYLRYRLDSQKFRGLYSDLFGDAVSQIAIEGGELAITSVTANAKTSLLSLPSVKPYLTGGGGLAWLAVGETRTSIASVPGRTFPAIRQNARSVYDVGAGVDFEVGFTFFVEARHVWIVTQGRNSTYTPVMLGVTF